MKLRQTEFLPVRSTRRLVIGLVAVFAVIASVYVALERLWPSLAIGATLGLSTCTVIAFLYRWRIAIPDYMEPLRQIRAQVNLAHVLGDVFLPFGDWAMEPAALVQVLSLVQNEVPHLVVECGSGLSTMLIGKTLQQRGLGRLISFEEDEDWYRLVAALLSREGLTDVVSLVHAPLEPYMGIEPIRPWYALDRVTDAMADVQHIDMLIIDGPISRYELSRYPALPEFAPWLDARSHIILDDANRSQERRVLAAWRELAPMSVDFMPDTTRGQALIRLAAETGSTAWRAVDEVPEAPTARLVEPAR